MRAWSPIQTERGSWTDGNRRNQLAAWLVMDIAGTLSLSACAKTSGRGKFAEKRRSGALAKTSIGEPDQSWGVPNAAAEEINGRGF